MGVDNFGKIFLLTLGSERDEIIMTVLTLGVLVKHNFVLFILNHIRLNGYGNHI